MSTTQAKTMRAARFYGAGNIKIENIPVPPPPLPHEITISPLWAGICGTDLHEYVCGPLAIRSASNPHPLTHEYLPVSLGHEFCGTISVLPEAYEGPLKLDMAVMVDPRLNCSKCLACRTGAEHLCEKWGFVGLHGGSGGGAGFSELVNVAQSMCHVLPETVNVNHAVLIEPLAVGRHAISASGIDHQRWKDLTVLVLGGGPVGLAVLYNLRSVGAGKIFVSEPTNKRQELVVGLGLAQAQNVLNPLICNIPDETRQKTEGVGVDVVFDCSGVPPAMAAGVESLKVRGVYVNVAGWEQPFVVSLLWAMTKELTFKFSMAYDNNDFKSAVEDFIAGRYEGCEKMITSRIDLDDLAAKGFEELTTKKDEHVKIVATPRKGLVA